MCYKVNDVKYFGTEEACDCNPREKGGRHALEHKNSLHVALWVDQKQVKGTWLIGRGRRRRRALLNRSVCHWQLSPGVRLPYKLQYGVRSTRLAA